MQISKSSSLVYDVLDNLDELGHSFSEEEFEKLLNDGLKSNVFKELVSLLTRQLKEIYNFEECVESMDNNENFLFEMNGFLKELCCPYPSLTMDKLNDRLNAPDKVVTLLFYLTTELQAAMIFASQTSSSCFRHTTESDAVVTDDHQNKLNICIKNICKSIICLAPDKEKITSELGGHELYNTLINTLENTVSQMSTGALGVPVVINGQILEMDYINRLTSINEVLCTEYALRRKMLIKRADVTISSFHWSNRAKTNLDEIARIYQPLRHKIVAMPHVTIANLLAARDDLSQLNKTSSGSTRHACAINNVVIGRVPDRGGRPEEVDPPPPEMPSWQKRQNFRGGANNQYSRGRGYHQSGFNKGFSNRGGGYNQHRGNRGGHNYNQHYGYGRGGFGRGYR